MAAVTCCRLSLSSLVREVRVAAGAGQPPQAQQSKLGHRTYVLNSQYRQQAHFCALCPPPGVNRNDRKLQNGTKHGFKHDVSTSSNYPRLTPDQATHILQSGEKSREETIPGPVKSYDWNQLSSNNPMEDTLAIAHCKATNGMLFAIYDGHGGPSCSQVISKRLLTYVCTALAKPYLEPYNQFLQLDQIDPKHFIQDVTSTVELRAELTSLYQESYSDYIRYLATEFNKTSPEDCITQAFIHLDKDISQEALLNLLGNQASYPVEEYKSSHKKMATEKSVALATLSVAMSGAVACVSYVHNNEIMVASVGDCQAVVGYQGEDGNWLPLKVSVEHTTENPGEVERIFQEHPKSERDTVLRMDRLLGQLMPLRALGDYRFKWPRNILEKHVVPIIGRNALPPNYKTPPYLSATPEIRTHKLAPKDKFLIVASDGLWDQLTPLEVVRLVGEHMSGREALGSLHLPQGDVSLAEINNMLTARREGLRKRPLDRNGATHLLRHALSTTETGLDHDRLSELLTMPDDVVRLFRDDISIIVIYFNTDYLIKAVP